MLFSWWRRRRRERVLQTPFPEAWGAILQTNVPYYARLSEADQQSLQRHIQIFISEKRFEGAGGMEITDEVRVTIAAQACILLLRRETDYYPKLTSIVVYPQAFQSQQSHQHDRYLRADKTVVRTGESWVRGPVILSWQSVAQGAADIHDGQNVVFHEFAHQLDQIDGEADGAPRLKNASRYIAWARVLGKEYERLLVAIERHKPSLLDKYGGESPAEFFAVVTETFFEKPKQLKKMHPKLYEQLQIFYQQDPAAFGA